MINKTNFFTLQLRALTAAALSVATFWAADVNAVGYNLPGKISVTVVPRPTSLSILAEPP
jgi:hypothetical protein